LAPWIEWPDYSKDTYSIDKKRKVISDIHTVTLYDMNQKVWTLPKSSITSIHIELYKETLYAILSGIITSFGLVALVRQEVSPYVSLFMILVGIGLFYFYNHINHRLVLKVGNTDLKISVGPEKCRAENLKSILN
jgi:hypothetical protein